MAKLGSLFDGSGGFPLAGAMCGIEPAYASEVEPYPIAVTRSRFPQMVHLGDVSKVNGADIEPCDVITFGSPCQSLSVAGKQEGIKHSELGDDDTTQSGYFMEAVRIIKEMREKTNGQRPTFAVWENVPGAFSSNRGADLRCVLEELIKIVEPQAVMPPIPKGGWAYADLYVGDGWSLAYRTFDAQYIRTAQRRRRIYLVLDLRGERAGEILFKRESLRGYFTQSAEAKEEASADVRGGSAADDREGDSANTFDGRGKNKDSQGLLRDRQRSFGDAKGFDGRRGICGRGGSFADGEGAIGFPLGFRPENVRLYDERSTTLCNGTRPGFTVGVIEKKGSVYSVENHPADSRVNVDDSGKVQTLTSRMGTGGGNVPMVMEPKVYGISPYDSNGMKSENPHSGFYEADTSRTLDANGGNPACNQGGMAIVEPKVIALDRASFNQGENAKYDFEISDSGKNSTLVAKGPSAVAYCIGNGQENEAANTEKEICKTLNCLVDPMKVMLDYKTQYIVRRLTPTECARLQGFPDAWGNIDKKDSFTDEEYAFWFNVRKTDAEINGKQVKDWTKKQMLTWYNKLHTDSAEYKMWGNGIALPCALYVMEGIAEALEKERAI